MELYLLDNTPVRAKIRPQASSRSQQEREDRTPSALTVCICVFLNIGFKQLRILIRKEFYKAETFRFAVLFYQRKKKKNGYRLKNLCSGLT